MSKALHSVACELSALLKVQNLTIATAESCTGGWIAQTFTSIAGSSAWFDRGFVTYSNEAKEEMLFVPANVLNQFGAVSRETALAMAEGAAKHSRANVVIATTGIAGPDGGSPEKPVGLVWFGFKLPGKPAVCRRYRFSGDREAIRHHAVYYGIATLYSLLQKEFADNVKK